MTLASIKSLAAGIGGVVVLALFCTTFLTVDKVVFIIPVFVAFTGAMTGFQLVDSLRENIRGRYLFPLVMGVGQGAAVFALIRIAAPLSGALILLTATDLLIYMIVSGITSILGARLAARYFNL
ncbi:MAG TPA: hypothetical protein DHV36_23205 [Desulfobacteraceae bacterium]|nr:hypothetical protein [Desulfobacteraceae bacterium]